MSPADDKKDEVETEVVDETTLEETPVEPTAEADEADAEVDEAAAEEAPAEVAEEPVAEEAAPKPRRSRAKKADTPPAEEPRPKAQPAAVNGARPVVRARAKYVRTSARKARLVCDHIRGKSVTEARAILAHTPRAVAEDWQKLLESAVANAEHNHELLGDDLRILSVTADEGPTLKRFQPRAMGRASRIRKRTAHLSIALTPKEQ
jgi:large subunit ribosomal protein L22